MTRVLAIKSWYSAERQGFITLEDDVLGIVRQIRQTYGDRITVELDDHTGHYHLVEHCEDNVDRLIFTTEALDGRVFERLLRADGAGRFHEDPYEAAEREQDAMRADAEEKLREKVREPLERLVHVMKLDGLEPTLPLSVGMSGSLKRRKKA